MTPEPTLRRATPADASELTRLRALMYEAYGVETAGPGWWEACERAFADRLAREAETFAAVVAEDPGVAGHLLACGVGWIEAHLPGPANLTGRRGHVASMSTEPAARRRGLARAVFAGLMCFFVERGVRRIDLRAAGMGEELYRSFGFAEPPGVALTWYSPESAPEPWR